MQALVYNAQPASCRARSSQANLELRGPAPARRQRHGCSAAEFDDHRARRDRSGCCTQLPRGAARSSDRRLRPRRAARARARPTTRSRATAHADRARRATRRRGRTWALSAQVQAYGLALTITFLARAARRRGARRRAGRERDRPARPRAGRARAAGRREGRARRASSPLGLGLAVAARLRDRGRGRRRHGRRAVAAAAARRCSALRARRRGGRRGRRADRRARPRGAHGVARRRSCVVLPVVFLGLVPAEIVPAAAWISDAFPFAHAVRFFASRALRRLAVGDGRAREAAWLVGLGAVFGVLARLSARRLACVVFPA